MKILSIRLKNLASLAGEHFIDFESDPLASAGLIAIVGKTGAGKSTILDAMCLSLFNKVPRLKESDGKLQDVDGSELAVNSPMTVLRRGCGHAFAELCFVAPDQKRYLARWEIKRARENPTGKLQNVQRSLKCLNDNMVLADKLKAVDEQVKLITQLSFDQFTRAVLLAQSEVTAFLKARDNERGELLEYLTNSVIFGKIGELAYRKTADIAKQRKQLEDVLGHIEILDADQLQQLQHTLAVSNQAVQDLSLEQKQLEQQQQWFQRQDKLQLELNNKQQALAQQQQLDQQLAADKLQRSKLDLCASIRPVLLQKQQQFQQQQQLAPQLHQAQQSFAQLTQQFELEQKNFLQDEQQLTQSQDFEQQYQPQLKQLRHCIDKRELIKEQFHGAKLQQTELQQQQQPLVAQQQQIHVEQQQLESALNTLSQQLQFSQAFQALDTGLDAHIQQLQQFIPAYTPIEQTLGHLKHAEQQLEQQQQALAQLEQQHGKLEQLEPQLEQQRQQREVQLQLCSQLERIQQQCQQLQARDTELKNLQQQAAQHQVQQQALSTQISAADNSYQQAKQQRMQLFDILQQQRLLHAENIEHLRADLKAGQPCVVCGSLDHPYRDNRQAISKALFELQQQQLKHAEADEQLALQHWQTQQQDASTCNASLAHIQKQIQSLSAELHQLQQQIKQHLDLPALAKLLPVQQPDDQQLIQLSSDAQRSCQQHVQQLEQQIKHATQGVKDLQSAAQQMQQQHYTLLQAKQLCAQIQHILPAEQTLASQPLTVQVQIILETLLQRAQQLKQQQQMQQRQQQLLQDLSRCHISLDSLVLQITALEQRLAEIEQQGLENTEIAMQQIQAMTGLSEQKPKEWLQHYDAALLQQQQRYRQSKLSFDQLRQQYEQQKQALQQLSSQSQHHAQNVEHATTEIERWLKQHPQLELAELEALLLLSSADEQRMRQALKQAEQALTQADAALKATQQQLDEHRQQQPAIDLDTLNSSLISQEQRLALQIEQRDQLKLKFELHQQSLSKQQQFMDQILEIQQQEHRWSKISDLMGSSTGKVFRDIAQQYHLDILIEYANQQLSLLSQRYTLKRLENSLSLAIIDHDMDGEMRSVSSLSGGESFLTALALSLAIANMASGSMKIESLFIDEGFGTLDAASLHMVMNALDQLQSQGRKVVLISHIQDMHERIPVQIQVNPRGAGASSIEIVG